MNILNHTFLFAQVEAEGGGGVAGEIVMTVRTGGR